MQVGDAVVWTQTKHYGNQIELSKIAGTIQSINGSKATVRRDDNGKKFVVALSELTSKSEDSSRSLLDYAFRRFGAGAAP